MNIDQLQNVLCDLESTIKNEAIPLNTVLYFSSYSKKKEKMTRSTGLSHAKSLLLSTNNMDAFISENSKRTTNISKKDIELNYHFLILECKLKQNDIGILPIILLHDPVALSSCWYTLVKQAAPEVMTELSNNPERLLNLLQYHLERRTNFRHMFALKTTDSTDEWITSEDKILDDDQLQRNFRHMFALKTDCTDEWITSEDERLNDGQLQS